MEYDEAAASGAYSERQLPWSVHDGQFFAEHLIRDGVARAPAERRLASDQLNAWVDGCSDFVGNGAMIPQITPFPRHGSYPNNLDAQDDILSRDRTVSATVSANAGQHWSVHDGQCFAEHVRAKRPRAPHERRAHRQGGNHMVDATRWRDDSAQLSSLPDDEIDYAAAAAERVRRRVADAAHQRTQMARAADAASSAAQMMGISQHQSTRCAAADAASAAVAQVLAPSLLNDDALHRGLLDYLPVPMLVRSATGAILYANRALTDAAGVATGSVPSAWQVSPQMPNAPAPPSHVDGSEIIAPEHDLPPDAPSTSGSVPQVPLPPVVLNCSLLLRDSQKRTSVLHPMHRIPFWLATGDGSNLQRAVVLYVQVQQPPAMRFFPAVSKSRPPYPGAGVAGM